MVSTRNPSSRRPAWFVGAAWGGSDDQTDRFLREGIWENGYDDRFLDLVKSVESGDRIAIKSFFTVRNKANLPFDDRGNHVSGMVIKAAGTVVENMGDGLYLKVRWTRFTPPREWYFSTYMQTIHAVYPGHWKTDALIAFAFDGQPQDIGRWRNDPQFRDKFGDRNPPVNSSDAQTRSSHEPGTSATYAIETIIDDGCFLDRAMLESILQRLETKQNIILQGPPGTGKTWLAKKLAYALIGSKDDDKVRPFQFHPNLSYEDFVRGWRPQGDGNLSLVDGPLIELAEEARQHSDSRYVAVIEEINRGNPASIFGEMLTLLEADKRTPDEALALAYPRADGERFHLPSNVYVIGTMNVADRSLAMVDLALRRRFAFFDLEPIFNDVWRDWVSDQSGIPTEFLEGVAQRMNALNQRIATDANLGRQFRVGHSYVTPSPGTPIGGPGEWFAQVVESEIAPLLREYWFDNLETAEQAASQLLNDL